MKAADEKFCHECGKVIKTLAEICPKCGVRQPGMAVRPSSKVPMTLGRNKILAAIIALFLGDLGIHKFYLGETGKGVLYLLFCWTLIPALLGFIDFLRLIMMSDEDFERRYNTENYYERRRRRY